MSDLVLEGLKKSFGDVRAVDDLSLRVPGGTFLTILGPSGCGKTTTLNMIAGLEPVDGGLVLLDGKDITDLPPHQRGMSMVFQNYALYPHKTVYGNLAFGLKRAKLNKNEIDRRVQVVSEMLEIDDLLRRRINQLSGGQQQRVSLARALVKQPVVFLFDEPLSNLDAALRMRMRNEIKRLHQDIRATSVFVTHDQEEAMVLSDLIAVMDAGRVVQMGTPDEIYDYPNSIYVASFVGKPRMNFIDARIEPDRGLEILAIPQFRMEVPGLELNNPLKVTVGVRAEDVVVIESESPDHTALHGSVALVEPLGADTFVELDTPAGAITARLTGRERPALGDHIYFTFLATGIHVFDANTGARINYRKRSGAAGIAADLENGR